MRLAVFAVLAACVSVGAPSAAIAEAEPYVLPAESKWNVDFGASLCRLSRTFGSGPNTHVLVLDQTGSGASAAMTVAGPSFERFRANKETLIDLGGSATVEAEPQKGQLGKRRYGIAFADFEFSVAGQETQGDELDVAVGNSIGHLTFTQGRRAVRLETGPMGEAFDVLNTCTKDLARG